VTDLGWNALALAAIGLLLWRRAVALDDYSIIDIAWPVTVVVVAVLSAALTPDGDLSRRMLFVSLTVVWAARLSTHLWRRHHGEDPRYSALRGRRSFLRVYLAQMAATWVITLPIQVGAHLGRPGVWFGPAPVGLALFLIGAGFEAVADRQLTRFRARDTGGVLETGLWRYSRHPNYFGEALLWWGLYLIAAVSWSGAATVVGPALMTWVLVRWTGKPVLEARLRRTRPGYADYLRRTSSFVPWLTKESPS
jgi:steroid 5-alpha reductase family enzyme